MIYQFFPAGKRAIIDGISWRFALLGVLNVIYVNLWAEAHYIPGTRTRSLLARYRLLMAHTLFSLHLCAPRVVLRDSHLLRRQEEPRARQCGG